MMSFIIKLTFSKTHYELDIFAKLVKPSYNAKHQYTHDVNCELKELTSDILEEQVSGRLCDFSQLLASVITFTVAWNHLKSSLTTKIIIITLSSS